MARATCLGPRCRPSRRSGSSRRRGSTSAFPCNSGRSLLNALTALVACQFLGEVVAQVAHVPVPGPVIGMLLLLVGLEFSSRTLRRPPSPALRTTAHGLLSHLSLLFVPAGVGIVTQLDVLHANILPVLASIVLSTAAALMVTGWVMQRLLRPESVEDVAGEL